MAVEIFIVAVDDDGAVREEEYPAKVGVEVDNHGQRVAHVRGFVVAVIVERVGKL